MSIAFVDGIQLAIHPTVATLPAHQKGVMVWSDAHGGPVVSDGVKWQSPLSPSYSFPAVSGDFFDLMPFSAVPSSGLMTVNGLRLGAFIPHVDFDCNQLDVNVTGAVAGSNLKMLIYASDGVDDWLPGTLLFNSGDISSATSGVKTSAISPVQSFKTGKLYWIGAHISAAINMTSILAGDGQHHYLGAISGAVVTYLTGILGVITYASGPPNPGNTLLAAAQRASTSIPRVRMRIN